MSARSIRDLALQALRDGASDSAEHWDALISGRWSLVDQFDAGGRRYLIAVRAKDALTEAEQRLLAGRARGVGLKVLADELGVSIPTVSRRLSRAMEKLGVRHQAELARVLVFG